MATALTVLAALVVLRLPIPSEAPDQHEPGQAVGALAQVWSEAREGWTVLRRNITLWRLTVASMLVNLGLAAHSAIEVVLILRTLGLGSQALGVIVSVGALGALTGSLVAVSLSERFQTTTVLRASMLLLAPIAGFTLVALLDPGRAIWWLTGSTFLWGVTIVVYNVVNAGWTARITPPRLMGRVSATRRTLAMGVIPTGSLAGGFIADHAGMPYAVTTWIVLNAAAAALVLQTPIKENTP